MVYNQILTLKGEKSLKSEHVAKGAVYLTAQSILGYIFIFLFYILIARVLGPTEIGKLSILFMIAAVFSMTNLSINIALQKFIPTHIEEEHHNEVGSIIRAGLTVLTSISATTLIILIIFNIQLSTILFGNITETWPIIIILLSAFTLNFTTFFGGEMLGLGLFKETAIQNILNTGVSRTLAIILAIMGLGLIGVTLSWFIAAASTLIFSIYVLRHNLQLKKGFPIKRLIDYSLPVHIFTIIMFIQGWADIAILYALSANLPQIGTYYLVVSGAMILSIFYTSFSMVILPALSSRYSQNGINGISPITNTYIRIVCKILVPVGISFAVLSSTAIELAYGTQYLSGTLPFAILAATSIIPALTLLIITIIQSTGNTKPLILIGIIASITDITIVATLATPLGGIAGATGRIAFSTISLVIGYYFIRNKIKLPILSNLKQPLIAAGIIATPLYIIDQYLTQTLNLTLKLKAPIEILTFITLTITFTYLTHYLTKEDFDIIKQSMPKKLEKTINKIEKIFT